ncbi:hypothetical protein D3OALGB2SA_443 [Olavius algarvensis associated proteobacterium Delta 3]|nr:hypothetical protein D3OALGB2SA_443 [Olavius algarvensis associated proteobacterium Delta 3]
MTQSPNLIVPDGPWTRFLDNSAAVMLGATIFFIPFPFLTSIKEALFYLPVTVATAFIATGRTTVHLQHRHLIFLYIFAAWAFLIAFFSLDPKSSLHDVFFHLIKYILYYFALLIFFTSKARLKNLAVIFFVSASLLSGGLLVYFYVLEQHPLIHRLGQSGLTEISTNLIAFVTTVAFVFGLHLLSFSKASSTKILLFMGLFILCVATASTQSRSAIISLMAGIGGYLFFRNKVATVLVLILLIALTAAITVVRVYEDSIRKNVRISLNLMTIDVTNDYPITGVGFGTDIFGKRIDHTAYNLRLPAGFRLKQSILESHTKEPHGTFASIAVRTGWPGLVLFCLFIGSFFNGCIHLIRSSEDVEIKAWAQCLVGAMVGMLVVGIFEQCLTPVTDMVFYTVVGMAGILLQLDSRPMDADVVTANRNMRGVPAGSSGAEKQD